MLGGSGEVAVVGKRDEREGARIAGLAAAPPRLRRALARVAGRVVATKSWERLGSARLGDYAEERAGVSPRELRELAAVDRALARLAGLEMAFLAGRIGWTQLRLLCRVATPEDQGRWLALAEQLGARELAREVRAVDARAREPLALGAAPGERREGVVLGLSRRVRGRWWGARNLASRVSGHRLSHSEFAEVLSAELISAVPSAAAEEARSEPAADACLRAPPARPRVRGRLRLGVSEAAADATSDALERDLEAADPFELDARLRRGLGAESRHLARLAAGLVEAAARGLHREAGFNNLDRFAEERLGISRSKARGLLRVERACRECPALRAAFASGDLSWVRAQVVLGLLFEPATALHREAWIAHACRVSVRRLREDVERALVLGEVEPPRLEPAQAGTARAGQTGPADPAGRADPAGKDGPAGVQTGANARTSMEDARLFFNAPPEVARLFRAVLAAVQRRIERLRGRPATRVQFRSQGGRDDLSILTTLWPGEVAMV